MFNKNLAVSDTVLTRRQRRGGTGMKEDSLLRPKDLGPEEAEVRKGKGAKMPSTVEGLTLMKMFQRRSFTEEPSQTPGKAGPRYWSVCNVLPLTCQPLTTSFFLTKDC